MIIESATRLAFAASCLAAILTLPAAHAQMGGTIPGGYGPPGAYGYGPPPIPMAMAPRQVPMAMVPRQPLMAMALRKEPIPHQAAMARRRAPMARRQAPTRRPSMSRRRLREPS